MFYEPGKTSHNLPHDPFKSCVVPRPIGWISTLSAAGVPNLAPYSQFQNLTFDPPYVMFAANQNTWGERKDSVTNAEQTGEFVWNMATYELREAARAALRYGHDQAGLARIVAVARASNTGSRQVLGGIGMVEAERFVQGGHEMVLYESRLQPEVRP